MKNSTFPFFISDQINAKVDFSSESKQGKVACHLLKGSGEQVTDAFPAQNESVTSSTVPNTDKNNIHIYIVFIYSFTKT